MNHRLSLLCVSYDVTISLAPAAATLPELNDDDDDDAAAEARYRTSHDTSLLFASRNSNDDNDSDNDKNNDGDDDAQASDDDEREYRSVPTFVSMASNALSLLNVLAIDWIEDVVDIVRQQRRAYVFSFLL
jgi:hypothetical protein